MAIRVQALQLRDVQEASTVVAPHPLRCRTRTFANGFR